MNNKYTVRVEEDTETGDLILPLPQELFDNVGWQTGDTLKWIDNKNGTFSLIKAEEQC
jgi:hypothetical protein